MHSCISEMLFVHPEDSLQSLFTLSFLRTATLPSENASKKPQGPRKTPMGRTGRAQLPSGICSNEIVKALLKGHKRGPMVEIITHPYLHLDLSQPPGIEQLCGCLRLNISIQSDGDRLIINFSGSNDIPMCTCNNKGFTG